LICYPCEKFAPHKIFIPPWPTYLWKKIAAETPERQQFMPLIEYLIKKVLKMLFPSQQIYIIF